MYGGLFLADNRAGGTACYGSTRSVRLRHGVLVVGLTYLIFWRVKRYAGHSVRFTLASIAPALIMPDLLRQEIAALATAMVVKVGTQVLTRDDGQLDQARIDQLARQLHDAVTSGRKVVLVSSGAVGAGMGRLGMTQRPTALPQLQAVAAIGQSLLVEAYERALSPYGHHAVQVLLTAEDLEHRTRYLNARNTLRLCWNWGPSPSSMKTILCRWKNCIRPSATMIAWPPS